MIYDHIKDIRLYKGLTPAIDTALDYIASPAPNSFAANPWLRSKRLYLII